MRTSQHGLKAGHLDHLLHVVRLDASGFPSTADVVLPHEISHQGHDGAI